MLIGIGDWWERIMIVITLMSSPPHWILASLWIYQRQLQVSLLWHPGEARLTTQPAAGRHAVHGHAATACPPETEVSTPSPLFPFFPLPPSSFCHARGPILSQLSIYQMPFLAEIRFTFPLLIKITWWKWNFAFDTICPVTHPSCYCPPSAACCTLPSVSSHWLQEFFFSLLPETATGAARTHDFFYGCGNTRSRSGILFLFFMFLNVFHWTMEAKVLVPPKF